MAPFPHLNNICEFYVEKKTGQIQNRINQQAPLSIRHKVDKWYFKAIKGRCKPMKANQWRCLSIITVNTQIKYARSIIQISRPLALHSALSQLCSKNFPAISAILTGLILLQTDNVFLILFLLWRETCISINNFEDDFQVLNQQIPFSHIFFHFLTLISRYMFESKRDGPFTVEMVA